MKKLLFLVSLLLASCASVFDTQWYWTGAPPRQPVYVYLTTEQMERTCAGYGTGHVAACAVVKDANQCVIFLPFNAPPDIKAHEEKHCQGYDHP